MATNTIMDSELIHTTIDGELVVFKENLLKHPAIAAIQNHEEFQNYLDTELKLLSERVTCDFYIQKQMWISHNNNNALLEKARCVIKLQNLAMTIHNRQCSHFNK
ncbi:hypothetical protein RN001_006397 [Aquatica leii]|uniref:Uncharacterized protein n=1 Tax=Aquatica leii TaxID=1421715 RepID=A0AAN7SQ74_9COLE|nr:hypothetical protein RN001_006397 [Aquatica leii]